MGSTGNILEILLKHMEDIDLQTPRMEQGPLCMYTGYHVGPSTQVPHTRSLAHLIICPSIRFLVLVKTGKFISKEGKVRQYTTNLEKKIHYWCGEETVGSMGFLYKLAHMWEFSRRFRFKNWSADQWKEISDSHCMRVIKEKRKKILHVKATKVKVFSIQFERFLHKF